MIILKNILEFGSTLNSLKLSRKYLCLQHCAQKHSQADKIKQETKAERAVQPGKESIQKSLHIAVIGVPNAGKSTFINNLIHHRVCPTSSKVHTTRNANTAICTTKNSQLVLFDTPGLVTPNEIKKHNLANSFRSAYRNAIQHADIIAVLHDVSNTWTRNELHSTVIDTLKEYPLLPSFLVMNKIDTLKSKRILLELIRKLTNGQVRAINRSTGQPKKPTENRTKEEAEQKPSELQTAEEDDQKKNDDQQKLKGGWENFEDIFLVSSITGNGLEVIHDYLIKNAKPRPWQYPGTDFTDEKPENLIVESVRARLLDYLPQEIPYSLTTQLEYYSDEKTAIYTSVLVTSPTARIERLICGESDGRLRQITERVTSDLVETFGKPISLTISTTSKKEK